MKKNKNLVTLYLLFLLLFYSCNNYSDQGLTGEALINSNIEYQKVKKIIPEQFVDHFPQKLDERSITFMESRSPAAGLIRLDLINTMDDVDLVGNFNIIAEYDALDSCLLIANRFASLENFSYNITLSAEDKKIINLPCYQALYPIPNFWHHEYTTEETACKLPADFKIYVIDADSGKFLNDSLLTNGEFMPQEWKNGFSKGLAISKKRNIVIYWVIIW